MKGSMIGRTEGDQKKVNKLIRKRKNGGEERLKKKKAEG